MTPRPGETLAATAPPGAPSWAALRRTLTAGVIIGAFLGLTGAYGSGHLPLAQRMFEMMTIALAASLLGMVAFAVMSRIPAISARWWLHGLAAAVLMTAPMALVVWIALQLVVRPAPPFAAFPGLLPTSALSSAFFCLWAAWQIRRRRLWSAPPTASTAAAAAKFLDRLPPRLHGAELWAVEAQDHYLRLHTSLGQELILMRFSDALGELQGVEGAQVHRSWWVARAAIVEARRSDGRAELRLKSGVEAPVSRTFARQLRAGGWI
jgi:DNA-binding LytR/AlgR family response regulator